MWVLIVAAYLSAAPTNEPRAVVVAAFPTARACIEAKRDLGKQFEDEAGPELTSYGLECAEVKVDKVPKKVQAKRS